MTGKMSHPYFPRDLYLPHYKPNDRDIVQILVPFFGIVAVVLVLTWIFTGRLRHMQSRNGLRMKMCWFICCGLIHSILEGYFAANHRTLAGEHTYLAEVWKEYGKGDSRYISSDAFVVCVESVTAVIDGPLAFAAFYTFVRQSPHRYLIQLIVSLCQLYGDVLYFLTEIFEGFKHGEAYHPLYFWFYFVFMNAIWIVIPSLLIIEAYQELTKAQTICDKSNQVSRSKKH